MRKRLFITFCALIQSTNLFSADTVFCSGSCQGKCTSQEKLSIAMMEKSSSEILKNFELKSSNTSNAKGFIDSISGQIAALEASRKNINETCLDNYCEQNGKHEISLNIGNGLSLSYPSPICDYSKQNRYEPLSLLVISLTNKNGSLGQLTFNKKNASFNLSLATPSQKCTENEGGTFDNLFVVSQDYLSVVPNDSSAEMSNNPVGAQVIRKKKFVPSFTATKDTIVFNLGDNHQAVIDTTTNTMKSNTVLRNPCKGTIGRNSAKKTSHLAISPNSLNSNGAKVYDSNNYKLIESDRTKIPW
jgi:hypothetical protein